MRLMDLYSAGSGSAWGVGSASVSLPLSPPDDESVASGEALALGEVLVFGEALFCVSLPSSLST